MLNYLLRRMGYMAITMIIVAILGYVIIELPPGSYVEVEIQRLRQQGGNLTAGQIETLYQRYGLDQPEYVRFYKWITAFVQGDFGQSFAYNMPVKDLIWGRIGLTLVFSILSLIFSWVVAIAAGVYSATHRNTIPDYIITVLQFIGLSVPNFSLALVLMVFAQNVLHQEVGGLFSSNYVNAPWSLAKFWTCSAICGSRSW